MNGTTSNEMGLTKCIGKNEERVMTESVDKEGIDNICLNENQGRFTQTNGTHCTISPISDKLDLLCTFRSAMDILKGTYEPPIGVNDGTRSILSHLKFPLEITLKVQPDQMTCEE